MWIKIKVTNSTEIKVKLTTLGGRDSRSRNKLIFSSFIIVS